MLLATILAAVMATAASARGRPAINAKVYHHVTAQFEEGHAMFQHFGVSTFGAHNSQGVGGANDCWHGGSTKPDAVTAPCLDARLFDPANYSAAQSMQVAKAFGAR